MYNSLNVRNIETIEIKYRFKMFPYLVCGVDRQLYQLTHFKKRRTCYFKKIPYNVSRKGYRVNSVWVSFSRLDRLKIESIETIVI